MRSTSLSPFQASVIESSASPYTPFRLSGIGWAAAPAFSVVPTRSPTFSSDGLSTMSFLSAQVSASRGSGARLLGAKQLALLPPGREIPERPKRRLPEGHIARVRTTTGQPASLDSVLIEPVERWSDGSKKEGKHRLKPNVLLFRVRGARPIDLKVKAAVTVRFERRPVAGGEASDVIECPTVCELPQNLTGQLFIGVDVHFSPDFPVDVYPKKNPLRLCDRNILGSYSSFKRCYRKVDHPVGLDVQEATSVMYVATQEVQKATSPSEVTTPEVQQSTSPDPMSEPSPDVPRMVMGSLLLPASNPLWFLLAGNRPRWLFADDPHGQAQNAARAEVLSESASLALDTPAALATKRPVRPLVGPPHRFTP